MMRRIAILFAAFLLLSASGLGCAKQQPAAKSISPAEATKMIDGIKKDPAMPENIKQHVIAEINARMQRQKNEESQR